ncbi:MAG TPA: hypothetical protein VGK78_09450 [Nocardioides sp.]|uniref:hypothetical protein n=1 Tax=Nocardioides sp. TaxID=35761 RepID=UPI002F41CB64
MLTTKLGAVLASLAITTGAAATLSATPAQAQLATSLTTTSSLKIDGQTKITAPYGTLFSPFQAFVQDSNGVAVQAGSTLLQRRLPGRSWATVKTDADPTEGGVSFGAYGTRNKGNVQYRLHYLGGTDTTTATTYGASFSPTVTVITLWKIKDTSACPYGKCHISGKLTPTTRNHKVAVQIKRGSWQRYKVLRTNSKSAYRVGVSTINGRTTKYRIIIAPLGHRITATKKLYTVYRVSRAAAPRGAVLR